MMKNSSTDFMRVKVWVGKPTVASFIAAKMASRQKLHHGETVTLPDQISKKTQISRFIKGCI